MRNSLFIFVFLFCTSLVMGQTAEQEVIRLKQQNAQIVLEEEGSEEKLDQESGKESAVGGQWNFSVGTSYSYMKGYGSGMMLYTAPSYTLSLNNRWSVHGGMIASRYQGMNYTMAGENMLPSAYSSLALYVAASYRMSDKLILHGTGVKQLVSAPVTPFTPYPIDDLSFGATYKLGDNFTIGASIHMNNSSGYFHSPWNAGPFLSPFPSPSGW